MKQDTVAAEDEDDAMTFNQDAIAHRLQQDVSEAKGRHYKLVADKVAAGLASAGAPLSTWPQTACNSCRFVWRRLLVFFRV